jgi:hypothetical protein
MKIYSLKRRKRRAPGVAALRLCGVSALLLLWPSSFWAAESLPAAKPRVFLLNAEFIEAARRSVQAGDKNFVAPQAELEKDAQKSLKAGPFSVMNKKTMPPSGDKHDFMSQAPYFWPDPKSPDGLPYIRRDGERNPEIYDTPDRRDMGRMIGAVETLSLAYYFTTNEAYAEKAAELLRSWFLGPATRMNPNFEFAQSVRGQNTGRGTGLIETIGLTSVVDSVGLLAGSKAWTKTDQDGLLDWYSRFLTWMQASKNGRAEAAAGNNHGTYYDLQVVSFSLFLGKQDQARKVLEDAKQKRIAQQIGPDGRQPRELERTRSWSYSIFNLRAFFSLATLSERVGVDLWNFETADGRSICKALDFLTPFALKEKKWPYRQLGQFPAQELFPLLRRAVHKCPDGKYGAILSQIPALDAANRQNLLLPKPVNQKSAGEPPAH